ncbi:AraC-type DNA-binding protein [Spirosomataceae bacterium TFI 002]|nr:AraC-type DNA-binding protein [Spirosomataceae bacterium TFI 002]
MLTLTPDHFKGRKLQTLVENQTTHTLNHAEMHIFETHTEANQVLLKFKDPVLASMISGKKVMHLNGLQPFDFYPGESVVLPANELMCIDFPEARRHNATQCLALTFANDKLLQTITLLNERMPKQDGKEWNMTDYNFHFSNDVAIEHILQRLLFIFAENHPSKDIFADSLMQELLIRILQTESKDLHLQKTKGGCTNDRISFIIKYIQEHLTEDLNIDQLSEKAYMSESSFYRIFKNEIGQTPNEFIIEERLKLAETLLSQNKLSVKEAYLSSGFNSFSYFCRIFKKKRNLSPSEFKEKNRRTITW